MIILLSFFLITDLYFLIPAVISKIFNSTAELQTPTNKANAAEVKIRKCSM